MFTSNRILTHLFDKSNLLSICLIRQCRRAFYSVRTCDQNLPSNTTSYFFYSLLQKKNKKFVLFSILEMTKWEQKQLLNKSIKPNAKPYALPLYSFFLPPLNCSPPYSYKQRLLAPPYTATCKSLFSSYFTVLFQYPSQI